MFIWYFFYNTCEINKKIQKVELQVMCLEDLQTHYSKQMDMVIAKNRSLANELRYSLNALKSTNLVCILILIKTLVSMHNCIKN